jgi:RHH-type proline utilization regulon transcriptional repressor/proline dehydrogenase/delta 1-pyrroline-5-carboxylate dehydrogenase
MGLFDKGYLSGKMMEWSMQYPAFKIEMFRFVDVLPSLHNADQIAEHIRQYFLRPELEFPAVIRAGLGFASSGLTAKLAASSIKKNVASMAQTFITGENVETARKTLQKLWKGGFCFTVDILGEAALSKREAEAYQARYLDLIRDLARESKEWSSNPVLEASPLGSVPRANVSVKCSSLYSQLDNMAFRASVDAVKERLRPVLRAAVEGRVFVNLDMEQNDYRDMFMTVAEEIFCEPEFEAYPHFGLVVQAYLLSASSDIERVKAFAARRKAPVTVRLVKGAYWDYEVIQAEQRGWPVPVFMQKAETDANYERCTAQLLEAYPKVLSAFGTHNVRSIAFALSAAEALKLDKTAFELQMLFGMAEPFKKTLAEMGYRVREYAPVGEILPGMAYLVRRLLENTSNEGFLRASFVDHKEIDQLLANPNTRVKSNSELQPQSKTEEKSAMFQNEALRDFTQAHNRDAMNAALKKLRAELPITVNAIVNGRVIENLPLQDVKNPSDTSQTVTRFALSTTEVAEEAVKACEAAIKTWGVAPVETRCAALRKAAQIMHARKDELAATMVLEVGKNFREADADVAEAIDFCNYYAQEMEHFSKPRDMGSSPGESNQYLYYPRGPAVAIAPWNFPLAILCGMTAGPLVAGNPTLMKPAEQSSGIALKLYKIFIEAGIPKDAVHLVPGQGETVGRYLVQHPKIHVVSFTGSRAVGLQIMEEAAKVGKGQKHLKKVVCELGGKNAIIVDEDADLDEAVVGALNSAFSFQGQKCSALSRLIVHESCYDRFKERFKEAMLSLKIGTADDPSAKVGPVIDEDSQRRVLGVIERNRDKIVAQLEVPAELKNKGHFVPPTIFESSDFQSELGQQEFFGPLVTLFKVKSFDEAIRAMNDVDYALTGGIFSRSPKNLERARRELEVGNLYINRGITGALVYKQPFGGFKLSGAGGKAGGPDYLLLFLEPRSVTENTMRRGFAPEIS